MFIRRPTDRYINLSGIGVRSGGGGAAAAFSPLDIDSLIAWYDFSDAATLFTDAARTIPVTADGDVIGGVTDKSGLGNHFAQTTTAHKPLYKVGIKNGLSVARFDVTDALKLAGDINLGSTYTLNIVVYRNSSSENIYFSDNAGSNYYRFNASNGVLYLPGSVTVATGFLPATWLTHTIRKNGATTGVWRNGASVGTGNGGSLVWRAIGLNGSFSVNGDVGEAVVCSTSISDDDRASLETYSNDKWAVY